MIQQIISTLLLIVFTALPVFGQFEKSGFMATGQYKTVENSGSTSLEDVYVFHTLTGATVSYTTSAANTVNVYLYETSYSEDKIPVSATPTPAGAGRTMYTVSGLQDYRGLAVDDNGQVKAVWIIDYSLHRPRLNHILPVEAEDKCEVLKLSIGKSDMLYFRETGGQQKEIDREYDIEYDVLHWNEERFVKEAHKIEGRVIGTEFLLDQVPNIDTRFTMTGDQFGKAFGIPSSIASDIYHAVAVEAHIIAKQHTRDSDNEKDEANGSELGGSAPVEIDFYGYGNEPVADHYAWYIHDASDTKNPVARYNDKDMNYVFEREGNYKVRLEVGNTVSDCVDSLSVDVNISNYLLDIPNFFSPRGTPGQNDVFKVSYRSIVKFKCSIFNRWGNKVYEWTDPSQGWDGRYKGRLVNPGVYYYVIEATGSDGKRHREAGDINIL